MSLSYLLLRGQWRLAPSLTRTIFSDEYLGGDKFLAKKEDYLNTHSVAQRERQKAVALQQTGAAQDGDGSNWGNVLLSDDVERLLYSASNSEDLEAAADVIRMFARRAADTRVENPSVQRMNRTLARDFTVAGRQLRVLAPVKQLVGDPTFQKQIQLFEKDSMPPTSRYICLNYCQLLFDHDELDEMLAFFDWLLAETNDITHDLYTLAMAACFKKNDFTRATQYVGMKKSEWRSSRAALIYALLAAKHGHFALAHEELKFARKGRLRANMQVFLFAKMGRFDDAIDTIEESVRPTDEPLIRKTKPWFSVEAVKTLSEAVESCSSSEMKKKIASLFNRLDSVAEISNQDLEYLVFVPIEGATVQVRRRLREHRQQPRPIQEHHFSEDLKNALET